MPNSWIIKAWGLCFSSCPFVPLLSWGVVSPACLWISFLGSVPLPSVVGCPCPVLVYLVSFCEKVGGQRLHSLERRMHDGPLAQRDTLGSSMRWHVASSYCWATRFSRVAAGGPHKKRGGQGQRSTCAVFGCERKPSGEWPQAAPAQAIVHPLPSTS